jgi:hypothetical protein
LPEGFGSAAAATDQGANAPGDGGDDDAAAAAVSEAGAAAAAAPRAPYAFDPVLAQAVWAREGEASAAAVAAAEQPAWPCAAEVYYLTADAEDELDAVPWHPGVV